MGSVDGAVARQALDAVAGPSLAVVLFGSHARGRATAESDIDVLQIVCDAKLPYRLGPVSVSPYTLKQLLSMASKGSLFVLHVLREGVVLHDNRGPLEQIRAAFQAPGNYEGLRRDVCAAARLLDIDDHTYALRWQRFHALVAHLVRSDAYALLSDRGELVFSMPEVAHRLGDPRLLSITQLARRTGPDVKAFRAGVAILADFVSGPPMNPYGSIEALVVNSYGRSVLTVILGLRLLNDSGEPLEYESLEEVATGECSE